MKLSSKFQFGVGALFLFSILFYGCRKSSSLTDGESTVNSPSAIQSSIPQMPVGTDPLVGILVKRLYQNDQNNEFASLLETKALTPMWNKALINPLPGSNSVKQGEPGQIVSIPFVSKRLQQTTSILFVSVTSVDTSYTLIPASRYSNYGFTKAEEGKWNATDIFHLFTKFDNSIFGHKKFLIKDKRLLKELDIKDDRVQYLSLKADAKSGNSDGPFNFCNTYSTCDEDQTARSINTSSTQSLGCYEISICTIVWSYGSGGGSTTGGGTTGTDPNSGGGGGSGTPGVQNCNRLIVNKPGFNLSAPCDDSNIGWTPASGTPYISTYQMTQHEIDVFNELDAEDATEAQSVTAPLDCKGTKTLGNVKFPGTKEHWLVQLDYIAKHPAAGEREFIIPNGAGGRSRADLVNTVTKELFEIKPDNFSGQAAGASEAAIYVAEANANCSSSGTPGLPWSTGGNYPTTYIPTGSMNFYGQSYIQARLAQPGVILYSSIPAPNPAPQLITIPADAIEKLKNLIDRLKGNLQTAPQVIAEYLHQHPELVTFLKGAALVGAAAIVVGTILEDVISAGAGVADDWACFVLAYRIVRFAAKL